MFRFLIQSQEHVQRKLWQGLLSLVLPLIIWFYWIVLQQKTVLLWTASECMLATIVTGIGLFFAFIFFHGRLRFWWTLLCLIIVQWAGQMVFTRWADGEFDFFNWYSEWVIYTSLFGLGWLMGWCLQRFRFGVYFFILTMALGSLYALRADVNYTAVSFFKQVIPAVIGTIWCLYAFELWRRFNFTSISFVARFWGRLMLSILLLGLLLTGIIRFYYRDIETQLIDYAHQTSSSEQLEKQKNGQMANKKNMGLGIKNQRSNNPNPIFCAYIPLNIPDTDIPNPLYMVSYHFNRFDTLTETFERDTLFKYADEFVPSPSNFTFFQTYTDSSVLKTFDKLQATQMVETDVYSVQLSNEAYVAPGTAFSVQPFPVDKRFKSQFTSAYKAKSRVSLLNSAYWVYNSQDPMLQDFQEQRFSVLRKANGYDDIPSDFLTYYTAFPSGGIYAPIKQLADSLQRGQSTALDKVLAVRDYYLQRKSDGSPLYSYSDNPGVPGLPGASRLLHFMFESHRGYCAYYAASTVALLRLMGLPARIVTGFMTVDRSDKNKGWYWFYEDQAHAWVQVYFPGYGWMDFDTTVGDEEAQNSPKPDGTPPLETPKATLVLQGDILSIDTIRNTISLHVHDAVIQNKDYHSLQDTLLLDVSKALFWRDSLPVKLNEYKPGQGISAVSYSKQGWLDNNIASWSQFKIHSSKPVVVDEIYGMPKAKEKTISPTTIPSSIHNAFSMLWWVIISILIIFLLLPRSTYYYFTWQLHKSPNSLYPMYRRILYVLHMAGESTDRASVMQWARNTIDIKYGVSFSAWISLYWEEKYSGKPMRSTTFNHALNQGEEIEKAIFSQWPKQKKLLMWFYINRYFRYWQTHYFNK